MSGGFTSEFPLPPAYFATLFAQPTAVESPLQPPHIPADFSIENIYNGSVMDKPVVYKDSINYRETLLRYWF